jgi:hypothetical protein
MATTVTGEVASLVADQRARMAVVVDHGASLPLFWFLLSLQYADRDLRCCVA